MNNSHVRVERGKEIREGKRLRVCYQSGLFMSETKRKWSWSTAKVEGRLAGHLRSRLSAYDWLKLDRLHLRKKQSWNVHIRAHS